MGNYTIYLYSLQIAYVLEKVVRQGGPFAGMGKTGQFEELVDAAVRLLPDGLPDRKKRWGIPNGVSVSEYGPFLKKVSVSGEVIVLSNRHLPKRA